MHDTTLNLTIDLLYIHACILGAENTRWGRGVRSGRPIKYVHRAEHAIPNVA